MTDFVRSTFNLFSLIILILLMFSFLPQLPLQLFQCQASTLVDKKNESIFKKIRRKELGSIPIGEKNKIIQLQKIQIDEIKKSSRFNAYLDRKKTFFTWPNFEPVYNTHEIIISVHSTPDQNKFCYFTHANKDQKSDPPYYLISCQEITPVDSTVSMYEHPLEFKRNFISEVRGANEMIVTQDQIPTWYYQGLAQFGTTSAHYSKDIIGENNELTGPLQKYQFSILFPNKSFFDIGLVGDIEKGTLYLSRDGKAYSYNSNIGLHFQSDKIIINDLTFKFLTQFKTSLYSSLLEDQPDRSYSFQFLQNNLELGVFYESPMKNLQKWNFIWGLSFQRAWKRNYRAQVDIKESSDNKTDDSIFMLVGLNYGQ